mmetsp:Transcript_5201/g.15147  ORF Transcript_5201/g.15147 Transcript_5201/m.15147 type:complete len:279 (-) Transcript_5201:1122-1958(-)
MPLLAPPSFWTCRTRLLDEATVWDEPLISQTVTAETEVDSIARVATTRAIATTVVTKTTTLVTTKAKTSNWSIPAKQQLLSDLFLQQPNVVSTPLVCDKLMHEDSNKAAHHSLFRNRKDLVDVGEAQQVAEAEVDEEEEEEGAEVAEDVDTTTIASIVNHLLPFNPIGSRWKNSISPKSQRICLEPVPPTKSQRRPWKMPFPLQRMYCGAVSSTNTTMFTTRSLLDSPLPSSAWQQRNFIPLPLRTILSWRSWPSMESVVQERVTREVFLSRTTFWLT